MAARIVALAMILGVGLLSAPLVATSQTARTVRIGVLRPAPDDPGFRQLFEPFRRTLQESGFREGTNLTIEWRVRAGTAEEMHALANELVRLKVDAIFAMAPAGVSAAARATKSIPIVAIDLETDPKAAGYAASLARPGGNITGLFLDFPELSGKWIQLLKEAVPRLTRVAVFWDPATEPSLLNGAKVAADLLKVRALPSEVRSSDDLAAAFKSAAADHAEAVVVLSSPVFFSARKQIAEIAAKHRLPTIMAFAGFVDDGGLIAYGPHVASMFQQAGGVMAKVLRGTQPADIPIERPTRLELALNLRTAMALGLKIPHSVLVQADRVIE